MDQLQLEPKKKLAHVQVYEKLYKMLQDGTFPMGTKLPSEPKLAKMLDVSRMTLRQALDLLNDDGILKKIQGSGNYVMDRNRPNISGLEQIGHPVFKGCKESFDDIQANFHIEPSNDYERELFHFDTPVIITIHTWYRSKGKLLAYTFGLIAVETITKYHLDLNDKESIVRFFREEIYEHAERAQLQIFPTSAGSTIVDEFADNAENVAMIQEKLFAEDLHPIVCNKHYILSNQATFEINIKKS